MDELTATINPGESSTPEEEGSEDLTPTVSSEETLKTEGEDTDDQKSDEDSKGDDAKTEPEEEPSVRFDKHPRFKALIEANRELRQNNSDLMGQVGKVLERLEAKPQEAESTENVQDLLNMSEEDLFEQLQDKPKEFLQKFAKSLQEGTRDQMLNQFEEFQRTQENQTTEQRAQQAYEQFGKENPDFWPMWDSGEIKSYMDKNPIETAKSAFNALKAKDVEKDVQDRIDEAVKKAVKAKADEINKNIKAKRSLSYLPAGPSETRSSSDSAPELEDVKKHGGMTSVLTRRLQRRRQRA